MNPYAQHMEPRPDGLPVPLNPLRALLAWLPLACVTLFIGWRMRCR